eukprot:g15690.t1
MDIEWMLLTVKQIPRVGPNRSARTAMNWLRHECAADRVRNAFARLPNPMQLSHLIAQQNANQQAEAMIAQAGQNIGQHLLPGAMQPGTGGTAPMAALGAPHGMPALANAAHYPTPGGASSSQALPSPASQVPAMGFHQGYESQSQAPLPYGMLQHAQHQIETGGAVQPLMSNTLGQDRPDPNADSSSAAEGEAGNSAETGEPEEEVIASPEKAEPKAKAKAKACPASPGPKDSPKQPPTKRARE